MQEPEISSRQLDEIAQQRWDEQFLQLTDKITPSLHQLLMQARNEAKRFDHLAVSTEHLLLALLRESDTGGALVLRQLGGDLLRIHNQVVRRIGPPGGRIRAGEAGLTPLAMQAILLGREEALRLGRDRADSEHLLLGLWRVGDSGAGQVLATLGSSLEPARLRVMRLQHVPKDVSQSSMPSVSAQDQTVTCQLDSQELDAVNALVVAGGFSTRGEAVHWLIQAGIAARSGIIDAAHQTNADIQSLREKMRALSQDGDETNHAEPTPPSS